jgi:hypothetical protein
LRTLGEIPHQACRILLFAFNGKFILKFEQGLCEQVFKLDQFEVETEAHARALVTDAFVAKVVLRFESMQADRLSMTDI